MSGGNPHVTHSTKQNSPKIVDPVLKAITAAGVALATIKTFVSRLLLPPFWEDCIVAVLLLASSVYWILELRNMSRRHPEMSVQKKLGTLALLVVQVGLCGWFLLPPLSLVIHGKWLLCGSFIIEKPQDTCLIGYDVRGREVADSCADLDQSGYVHLHSPHWWVYRPHSFAIKRSGVIGPHFVPSPSADLFSSICNGVVYPK